MRDILEQDDSRLLIVDLGRRKMKEGQVLNKQRRCARETQEKFKGRVLKNRIRSAN